MPKVMYSGVEYVSSVDSVSVTQAEYDALVAAGTVNPAVAYYITDAKDVTCNLGDLTDVNVVGVSTGNILVKSASGWESVVNSYNNLTDKPDLSVSSGTVARNTTNTTSANISYAKYGKVVHVGGYFYPKTTWTGTSTEVFILPSSPKINANPICQSDNSDKIAYLVITSGSRSVKLNNSAGTNVLRFSFAYVEE